MTFWGEGDALWQAPACSVGREFLLVMTRHTRCVVTGPDRRFLQPGGRGRLCCAPFIGGLQHLRLFGCRLYLRLWECFGNQTRQNLLGSGSWLRRLDAPQDVR